jgi:hypothetical protein
MWEAQADALNALNISTALVPAMEEASHGDDDAADEEGDE